MKNLKYLFLLLLGGILFFTSCEEGADEGDTADWQKKNTAYIDSIAVVAHANSDGTWRVIPETGLSEAHKWGNDSCVFCKVLQAGTGVEHPAYNDSVKVNYRGRLIPTGEYPDGFIFDSSYDGEFEPDFDVPVTFSLAKVVSGFRTAVQQMVVGDTWRVYIPANLAYKGDITGGIPAYSTLIFDINLVSFRPIGAAGSNATDEETESEEGEEDKDEKK